jgi:hypothetical protein
MLRISNLDEDSEAEEDEEGSINPKEIDEDNLISNSEGEIIESSVKPDSDDEMRKFVSNVEKYAEIISNQHATSDAAPGS